MSALQRKLAGDAILFDIAAHAADLRDVLQAGRERTARTLVKDGPLRVTLIALAAGAAIAEHAADGPIMIQPVSGSLTLTIAGQPHVLHAGEMVTAAAGIRHDVVSDEGVVFLLTVVLPAHG